MEAMVWSGTGLLPDNLELLTLSPLEDGRWCAHCEFNAGRARDYEFPPGEDAERRIADALVSNLGFTKSSAAETVRRLFEPFVMIRDWAW